MLEATRNGWADTFAYDGANRLTNTTQNGRAFTYTYNIPGRVQTNTEPSGRVLTYTYDARTRLTALQDGTPNPPIVTYTYDDMDRVITRTYRNSTASAYAYNADNWPTSITHSNTTSLIAGFNYGYDNEGNKLYEDKLDSLANSGAYGYDAANRLTNFDVGTLSGPTILSPTIAKSWNLDPLGNWNSVISNGVPDVRTYGPANELLTDNGSNYLYDADGNLTQDSAYKYAYDEENRLTQVQRLSDLAIVGQYQYDALSRRVLQATNPASVPGTNLFFYDNARLMEVWNGEGTQTAAFTYGNYIDETLTMDRGSQTYYYYQNGLWTTYALADASGNAVERYSYDVYGAVTVLDGSYNALPRNSWGTPHSAVGNLWLFTGRQLDEEDGLYYYRARYFDGEKGRFLQRDPLEYVNSLNLYEYVRSAPTFYDDPSGMICKGGTWSRTPWGKGINNNKTKLGVGFVTAQFSFTPEFSVSKCTAECCAESKNPGKEMTDYSGTAAIAWDASISAASWGGTIALGPIDVNAWLGIKGTIGAAGKFSISLGSDYCNNKALQGSGCFSIGPYGELAVGGEASAEIGWWNYSVGLTGSIRISVTWQVCVNCNSDGCSPTSFKYMGGTADFQVKGCLPYWGCVGGGFSLSF
jgi:RHS repeat-associated protein